MKNHIQLVARIISDITLNNTIQRNTPVANFRIIHKTRKTTSPLIIDVEIWGDNATIVNEKHKRGDLIKIHGELRRDTWRSKDDQLRSKIKITANEVDFYYKEEKEENEVQVNDLEKHYEQKE